MAHECRGRRGLFPPPGRNPGKPDPGPPDTPLVGESHGMKRRIQYVIIFLGAVSIGALHWQIEVL